MKITHLLEAVATQEPFVASDGTKNFAGYEGKKPNLSWKPPEGINLFRPGPRGSGDKSKSKSVLDQLGKDLEGYKQWVKDNPTPHAAAKAQTVKNCEKIYNACKVIDSVIDDYNEIVEKVNKVKAKDAELDAEEIGKLYQELRSLCSKLSNVSKDVNSRMGLPPFMSKFRTMAAQRTTRILGSRDALEVISRHARMSPKQREAAQKASARMKMTWGSIV